MMKMAAAELDKKATWTTHYFDTMIAACALQNSADSCRPKARRKLL
jgi:hypothetical protein